MRTCYVSIPFTSRPLTAGEGNFDFAYFYREVVRKTVLASGFQCYRADELTSGGTIHKTTYAAVLQSSLMLADVSSHNPNVLYELGLRHAIGRGPTIVLANIREKLPFALTDTYLLPYGADGARLQPADAEALQAALAEAIKSVEGPPGDGRFNSPLHELFPELHVRIPRRPCIFIGHGRSLLWLKVKDFLEDFWKLEVISYSSEPRASESIVPILEDLLGQAGFAVLVLTAEDEITDGRKRARQNVIHELGLFQGALGFRRAVILRQDGIEELSNLAGLQYINFVGDAIDQSFAELQRTLMREGLIRKE